MFEFYVYSYFDVFWFRIKYEYRFSSFRCFSIENQIPVSAARLWLLPVQVRHVSRLLIALSCCTLVALHVDAYKASIAIRIMSDTRDEDKDRNKDERCLARHPRSKK